MEGEPTDGDPEDGNLRRAASRVAKLKGRGPLRQPDYKSHEQ